jgi:predicted PurR-regulated permease PerM
MKSALCYNESTVSSAASDPLLCEASMSRFISFYILLGIILAIAILFIKVMASFLLPLFLAVVLVVVFKPLHSRLSARYPTKPRFAAGMTTGIISIAVIAPLAFAAIFAVSEGSSIIRNFHFDDVGPVLERIRLKLGFDEPYIKDVRELQFAVDEGPPGLSLGDERALQSWQQEIARLTVALQQSQKGDPGSVAWKNFHQTADLLSAISTEDLNKAESRLASARKAVLTLQNEVLGGRYRAMIITSLYPSEAELRGLMDRLLNAGLDQKLLSLGASTLAIALQLLFGLAIMLIGIYFFLIDGPRMLENIMRLSPLADSYERELVVEFGKVSRAVVLATLLSAIAQGLLAGIGYWFAGLESVFLLTLLTILLAMVPFVGAAAVWLPASLYLMLGTDHVLAGALLAAYGAIPVSLADNIIKPLVLKNHSQLHPLFALLSVLGGVQALGPIGILVGPMVVAFLQTLLNMLHREIGALEKEDKKAAKG